MDPLNLTRVIVSWDVLWACISHALTTEHQEIMGLLLGCFEQSIDGTRAIIKRSMVLSRKDKKKDRVEVGYEQLANASTVAEKLADIDGSECAVIGWYHSHPHITVLPSHVDVKTQGSYQQLDRGFLGLIFSVFDKGRIEVCAFQSRGVGQNVDCCEWHRVEIPVVIDNTSNYIPHNINSPKRALESLVALQLVLLNEDKQTFKKELSGASGASYLEISRTCSVYQAAVLRLVDLQLLALLMAMRSRIASLKLEKEHLLSLVPGVSTSSISAHEVKSPDSHTDSAHAAAGDSRAVGGGGELTVRELSWAALYALETAVPEWGGAIAAIQVARTGIEVLVDTESHSTAGVALASGRYVVSVAPGRTDDDGFMSPWTLRIGEDASFPLLGLAPGDAAGEVVCRIGRASQGSLIDGIVLSGADLIFLRFDESSSVEMGVARLFREELHKALQLHIWASCT